MNDQAKNANGKAALNWPTVALIIASGAGNFLTTQHGNVSISAEQQEALRKIRELHQGLDEFENRQKQALENQNIMMRNDARLIDEIHQIVQRLDRWKDLEQKRGAPP